MKKLIITFSILTLCLSLQAQQMKPDVINSSGGSAQYSGGYLAYTVGEPIVGTNSGSSVTLSQGFLQTWQMLVKQLAIKVFLEGLYAGGGMMNQAQGTSGPQFPAGIADKVGVELHNSATPYGIFYEDNNIDLHTDGTLQMSNLPSNTSGSYYIVIRHRNSMQTWSALPYSFAGIGQFSYDFSTSASQAYGNNQKLMGTVYAIWGGDPTQDGIVDGSDMTAIDNASKPPALQGYYPEDVNGDGIVDGSDMTMIDNNSKPPAVQLLRP
jgi:hypothetical protein